MLVKTLMKIAVGSGIAGVTAYTAWKAFGGKDPPTGTIDKGDTSLKHIVHHYMGPERPQLKGPCSISRIWKNSEEAQRNYDEQNSDTPTSSLQRLIEIFLKYETPEDVTPEKVSGKPPRTQPSRKRLEPIAEIPELENQVTSQGTQTESNLISRSTQTEVSTHSTVESPQSEQNENTSTKRSVQPQTDETLDMDPPNSSTIPPHAQQETPTQTHDVTK